MARYIGGYKAMKASTEVELTRLRNKFENRERDMRNRNDRLYWVSFSRWIIENHNMVAKIKLP